MPDRARTCDELHVFSDDNEWVVARSPEDADAVSKEDTGYEPEPTDPGGADRWEQLPDDGTTKMWCDANGKVCEIGEGTLTELTNREWCQRRGRGYLGGLEG